jgi:hypothetical protein
MTINIEKFAGVDDYRTYLNRPWRRDGKLYATNGHFMIEIDDDGRDAAAFEKQPDCVGIFAKHTPGEFMPIPPLAAPARCEWCKGHGVCYREACPDCDGNGEFMRGMHEYECKRCEGDGYFLFPTAPPGEKETRCSACYGLGEEVRKDRGTPVGDLLVATRLLRVLTELPGVEVAVCKAPEALWFRFTGGRGLVMPMRK